MTKRLYKSNKSRMVDGVCAGIAEYFNIDPTIVRLIWVFIGIQAWGIIAYIVCFIVIPRDPGGAEIYTPPHDDRQN